MKTLLVPVDFSDVTAKLLDTAQTFARAFNARIHLLHITPLVPQFVGYEPGPELVRRDIEQDLQAERKRVDELKAKVAAAGFDVAATHVQGMVAEQIIEQCEAIQPDLVLMGSHGHGAIYNLVVGSVTSAVMRKSKWPVLVVPSQPAGK